MEFHQARRFLALAKSLNRDSSTAGVRSQFPTVIATGAAFSMIVLDRSIVNFALPRIKDVFQADLTSLQWLVDGYALVFASLLLKAARWATAMERSAYSPRDCSLLCGVGGMRFGAQPGEPANRSRGAGRRCGVAVPNSLAALNHTVKDPDRRKTAVAAWSTAGALGVALGPLVGGILVQYLDWRSIFLVNVPVGLVALSLARRHVASGSRQADREFDLSGQGLAIATLAVLTYWMISVGRSHEFSFVTIGLGGLVVLGGAFLRMKRSRSTRWCHSISYSVHLWGMSRSLAPAQCWN